MKLIIVESPSKAKTIEKYLGGDYKVTASGGHVCDLPERKLGVDVDNNFAPEYVINAGKKDTIKRIKADMAKAEIVYLATDPDREGEAISWHLSNVLGLPEAPIRIEFNEISKKAVNEALKKARLININLVDAQQARRVLDRLVGYKISPILAKKIRSHLSAGRVQSVALRMIVDREREILAFVPEEYWTFHVMLKKLDNDCIFKASLVDKDYKKIKLTCESEMKEVLESIKSSNWSVDTVKKGSSKSHPAAPFTTSTLTQDASTKLGMSAPQIMQIAQQLYEGIEIAGEGHIALVTYIRTDSVRIAEDAMNLARDFVVNTYGKDFIPERPNVYKSKKEAQDAHEAIRPISVERTPESLKGKLLPNQFRLYKLIYERFLASQMSEALYNTLSVRVSAKCTDSVNYGFKVTGKTVVFAGFTAVYANIDAEKDDEEASSLLPELIEGESLEFKSNKYEQKFTKPSPRYNDASLVKAMEENGIGRPSTYASIIAVLLKREYVEKKDKKSMFPTELGISVCDMIMKYFSDIMDLNFTANMENKLDEIEDGGKSWQNIIGDFYPDFIAKVKSATNDGETMKIPPVGSDVPCDKCGAMMVVRDGRYGKFLACPNFPTCKNVKSMDTPAAKCPKCGGDVFKRKSKKGKIFFGCSNYPKCDFISWDIPAPYLCPKCNSIMKATIVDAKTLYTCIDRNCNYSEEAKEND